jgi:hypothetical protein
MVKNPASRNPIWLALSDFVRSHPLVSVVCCVVIGYCVWPRPDAIARRDVQAVLLVTSITADQQIANLERFVRIGDQIDVVRRRLAVEFEDSPKGVKRRTMWSLGLQGVSLELAIESDGKVVGIGRHIHGVDDGPFWYAPPRWNQLALDVN